MDKKKYISPEFLPFRVHFEDVLSISNPRDPFEEEPSSIVDEGGDDIEF